MLNALRSHNKAFVVCFVFHTAPCLTMDFVSLRGSSKFTDMVSCVTETSKICLGDKMSESNPQKLNESTMCLKGSLEIPDTLKNAVASVCSGSFIGDADNCLRSFHQKFAADKADPLFASKSVKLKFPPSIVHDPLGDCQFTA